MDKKFNNDGKLIFFKKMFKYNKKISLYSLFAIISIFVNLLVQFIFFKLYSGPFYIYFGMILGTLAGLPTKYFLDKKWIFYHKSKSFFENIHNFILYSIMGVFTTMIFFMFELSFFYLLPQISYAKYIGALLGLIIGFIVKYFLDKKYVFKK